MGEGDGRAYHHGLGMHKGAQVLRKRYVCRHGVSNGKDGCGLDGRGIGGDGGGGRGGSCYLKVNMHQTQAVPHIPFAPAKLSLSKSSSSSCSSHVVRLIVLDAGLRALRTRVGSVHVYQSW